MAVREYIGARYVPVFADPLQWDDERVYEPLTMVQNEGDTYISRTAVPIGVDILNEDYWVFLTNWNAQVEQYRNEVLQYNGRISNLENGIPIASFDAENTVKDYIDAIKDAIGSGFTSEDTVKDYIDAVDDKLGSGFTSEDTVKDSIDAVELSVEELDLKINSNIRDMAWNCRFRQIVTNASDTTKSYSSQGMTMFKINDTMYLAQATYLAGDCTIILYNYDDGTEIARVTGNYGHINDMCYNNNVLYALEEANSKVHKFNVTASTITFNSTETIPVTTAALQIMDDGSWYTVQNQGQGLGIRIYHYTSDFGTELHSYFIPFEGLAVIQGISVNGNKVFIALTCPNTIVYYNISEDSWYYISVPQYIGHCMTDEIEGVFFDDDYNLYFNTNSIVDYQLMCSIFVTNLVHSVEKEVNSSVTQNRFYAITAKINATNGDLVSPGEYNHTFRLAGDAINYAKSLGNCELTLDFEADYPYPIVANGANITFSISDANKVITLNGIVARFCTIAVQNIGQFILKPTNITTLNDGTVIYGGYMLNTDFIIGVGTWHALASPDAYDSTHKKLWLNSCTVKIQETSYYRFYNCLVLSGSTTQSASSVYERTGLIAHVS